MPLLDDLVVELSALGDLCFGNSVTVREVLQELQECQLRHCVISTPQSESEIGANAACVRLPDHSNSEKLPENEEVIARFNIFSMKDVIFLLNLEIQRDEARLYAAATECEVSVHREEPLGLITRECGSGTRIGAQASSQVPVESGDAVESLSRLSQYMPEDAARKGGICCEAGGDASVVVRKTLDRLACQVANASRANNYTPMWAMSTVKDIICCFESQARVPIFEWSAETSTIIYRQMFSATDFFKFLCKRWINMNLANHLEDIPHCKELATTSCTDNTEDKIMKQKSPKEANAAEVLVPEKLTTQNTKNRADPNNHHSTKISNSLACPAANSTGVTSGVSKSLNPMQSISPTSAALIESLLVAMRHESVSDELCRFKEPIATANQYERVRNIIKLLAETKFSAIPLLDADDSPVGLISTSDFKMLMLNYHQLHQHCEEYNDFVPQFADEEVNESVHCMSEQQSKLTQGRSNTAFGKLLAAKLSSSQSTQTSENTTNCTTGESKLPTRKKVPPSLFEIPVISYLSKVRKADHAKTRYPIITAPSDISILRVVQKLIKSNIHRIFIVAAASPSEGRLSSADPSPKSLGKAKLVGLFSRTDFGKVMAANLCSYDSIHVLPKLHDLYHRAQQGEFSVTNKAERGDKTYQGNPPESQNAAAQNPLEWNGMESGQQQSN